MDGRIASSVGAVILIATFALGTGCQKPPPEDERGEGSQESPRELEESTAPAAATAVTEPPEAETPPPDGPFPSMGSDVERIALKTRYTRDIGGQGKLFATLDTSAGEIRCELFEDLVPRTVDNFVGLARGQKPWRDPSNGATVTRPFYDGLVFHRVIPGLLIQSGDPTGTGQGGPGYTFADEFGEGLSHAQPGVLSMAQSRPDGNGSQFFVTAAAAPHFDRRYPIFGLCANADIVDKISRGDTGDSRVHRPLDPVLLRGIRFERAER